MKVIRFILGFLAFAGVWITITGLVTLLLHPLLPGKAPDPIGVEWAAIPASFIGALVGHRIYQLITGGKATR